MPKLKIPVQFEKTFQDPVSITVLLADAQGNILQQSPVNDGGDATFDDASLQKGNAQIIVLPNIEDNLEGVTNIKQLERFKPYVSAIDWKNDKIPVIKPVPSIYIDWWKIRFCRVIGRLTKTYIINNISTKLPVCRARVHICEVDRIFWLIRKIPDQIILKIPDLFKVPVKKPPVVSSISTNTTTVLKPGLLRPLVNVKSVTEPLIKIDAAIARKLDTTNVQIIRDEIVKNIEILRPHFCLVPWLWPYFYRCDNIKTVYSDENGRFDTSIIYFADGDHPDIYIWVECLIDGVWTTVYRPSIACNTRWNYVCGSNIDINITDARVTPNCGPVLTGESIWVRTIGNRSIREVFQKSKNDSIQGVPFERKGLFLYGTDHRSPFATTLQSGRFNIGVIFGSGLPVASAKYFRWACRKTHNEAMIPQAGTAIYLTDEIRRQYLVERMVGTTKLFDINSVLIGPYTVNNKALFLIPPSNPVGFLGVTSSVGWMNMSVLTTSLDTRTLDGDGLYEFWLEIFNGSGNRVNMPQTFYQISKENNFNSSEVASGDYFGSEDGMSAFKMVVRIDSLNNNTVVEIYPVKLMGAGGSYTVSNTCGFLDFTDANAKNISIPFKAYQQNNFADFTFSVGRGNSGTGAVPTVAGTSGMVIGDAGRYVRDANSVYAPDDAPDMEFTPAELMQTCIAGGRAAFTENLYVAALHTDGYRRLQELDSSAAAAFALSKI